jgi:hypothetical protein
MALSSSLVLVPPQASVLPLALALVLEQPAFGLSQALALV